MYLQIKISSENFNILTWWHGCKRKQERTRFLFHHVKKYISKVQNGSSHLVLRDVKAWGQELKNICLTSRTGN